jgi:hypothetical protein
MVRQFLQITLQRISAKSVEPQISQSDRIGDARSRASVSSAGEDCVDEWRTKWRTAAALRAQLTRSRQPG